MMKRFILSVVLLFTTGGVAWAGKEAYILMINNNKELCESMLKLINEDMKQYKKIRYDWHEMFRNITWKQIDLGEPTFGCSFLWKANFDINNDGSDDLVIKSSGCLRDNLSDSLFIFPINSDILSRLKPGQGGLAPLWETQDKFARTGDVYTLKDLSLEKTEGLAQAIGGVFVIHPFIWKKNAYLLMTDLDQDWIVINKYIRGDTFHDECYLNGK